MSEQTQAQPQANFPKTNLATGSEDICLKGLPPVNTQRWNTKSKALVVEAVRNGRLSLENACKAYEMSVDEFLGWQSLFDRYGKKGLMTTRIKEYRQAYARKR